MLLYIQKIYLNLLKLKFFLSKRKLIKKEVQSKKFLELFLRVLEE